MSIQGILLDIEGTTTPISFVYDVLFPFARKELRSACIQTMNPEVEKAVEILKEEWEKEPDLVKNEIGPFEDGSIYAAYLMDQDRKTTGLKKLQGLIWEEGYREGLLKGIVFEDVPPALKRWTDQGKRIRIYSSGSVLAQKLLFGFSDHGDLTPFIEDYHDTTTGPKKEADSYSRITAAYGLPANEILFLSDNVEELNAAREAGLQTFLAIRPGNTPVSDHGHPTIETFDLIDL
ncbi:MAG: acireductone synthase [Candidatus Omnitrophica bacterium]|nr:acireductone synthase [Candidatus Omnitrophota bacterium]MCB9784994.1 acireductone synthase [Candidatus Omnitrophota bacterium]